MDEKNKINFWISMILLFSQTSRLPSLDQLALDLEKGPTIVGLKLNTTHTM